MTCRDAGEPQLMSIRAIIVRVIDDNDNAPRLDREVFPVDVHENNRVGDVLLAVNATDVDDRRNAALTFRLEPLDSPRSASDVVSIDQHSGVVTALTAFDFESRQTYSFLLTVSDGGLVSHSRVATVVLNVLDDNDEVPTFVRSSYVFHVPENRTPGSTVGRVRATDADLSGQHRAVFYSLEGHDSRAFRVAARTGELFVRAALDREEQPVWRFRARASNDPLFGARSSRGSVDVVVHVADVNDHFPVVRRPRRDNATFVVRQLLPVGHVVTRVEATDADDGQNARLSFAIINGGGDAVDGRRAGTSGRDEGPLFVIDEVSGDITTSRHIRRDDVGRYTLLVAVSDAGLPRRLTTTHVVVIVNVTGHYPPGQLAPPLQTADEDDEEAAKDLTLALIVGVCCVAVVVKLVVVAVFCVRHNVAVRLSSNVTQKVCSGDAETGAGNKTAATTASVWKRLHGHADHCDDVIPASCSVRHSPLSFLHTCQLHTVKISVYPRIFCGEFFSIF